MATGLPPSWEVRWSNSKKLPYYFNSELKTSQWRPPAGSDAYELSEHIKAKLGKISAAHILVKHAKSRTPRDWKENPVTRTKEEARIMLEGFEKRIKSGDVRLMQLAMTESDCKSAQKAGGLGYFGHGDMQKEFEIAAFALRPVEMSGIVETASGLHLIERVVPEPHVGPEAQA